MSSLPTKTNHRGFPVHFLQTYLYTTHYLDNPIHVFDLHFQEQKYTHGAKTSKQLITKCGPSVDNKLSRDKHIFKPYLSKGKLHPSYGVHNFSSSHDYVLRHQPHHVNAVRRGDCEVL